MWIVKNESAEPVALPELGVEVPSREYLDLDAHGRSRAEAAASVREALAQGALRAVSKSEPEPPQAPAPRPSPPSPPGVLRDLAENPPLLIPVTPPPPTAGPLGIREAFRRLSQRRPRREEEARPEEPPPTPQAAELRRELERFRRGLLEDIRGMLDDYLRP